ncbi:Vacuolar protein sorting-associated protein 62, partial [Ascosphaera atra]
YTAVPATHTSPQAHPSPTIDTDPPSPNIAHQAQQMGSRRIRAIICLLAACVLYVTLNSLAHAVHPEWFIWFDEDREEASWLASSDSWWDRKACRWLSLCGLAHYKVVGPLYGSLTLGDEEGGDVSSSHHGAGLGPGLGLGIGGKEKLTPLNFTHDERVLREIPAYVLEHAPLVHLYSHEQYWPNKSVDISPSLCLI